MTEFQGRVFKEVIEVKQGHQPGVPGTHKRTPARVLEDTKRSCHLQGRERGLRINQRWPRLDLESPASGTGDNKGVLHDTWSVSRITGDFIN